MKSTTYDKSFTIYKGTGTTPASVVKESGSSYGSPSASEFISSINTWSNTYIIFKNVSAGDIDKVGYSNKT